MASTDTQPLTVSSKPKQLEHGHEAQLSKPSQASEEEGFLDTLSPTTQFITLSLLMFLFFGIHNVLQEAMMSLPGFNYGVMLGYMEVIGVTVCSFFERNFMSNERGRTAPLKAYPLLTLCLLGSSALSNWALNYINFPTKVVFRSCKLIPTMMIATLINKRSFTRVEYMCAGAISLGLIMFAAADWKLTPSFNPFGILLVSLSVVADSVLPNAQERLFRYGASRLEVTLYTNFFTLVAMTGITLVSGDLLGILSHAASNQTLIMYMIVFTAISYAAISTYMQIVKRFGGVAAVLLTTARKGMTLILSFLLFPKAFSWYYVAGAMMVLGGLLIVSLKKQSKPKAGGQDKTKELEQKPLTSKSDDSDVDVEMGSKQESFST